MPTLHLVLDTDTSSGAAFHTTVPHGHHIIAARIIGYYSSLTTALQVHIPWLRPITGRSSTSTLKQGWIQFPAVRTATATAVSLPYYPMNQELQVVEGNVSEFTLTTDVDPTTTHIWIEYVTKDHY